MAEILFTEIKTNEFPMVRVFKWEHLTETNNLGQPIQLPRFAEKTIQVYGTWGSSGSVKIEGSLLPESPSWIGLADPQGNDLTLTASKMEQILENIYQVRPNVIAGTGVDLTVVILAVKTI